MASTIKSSTALPLVSVIVPTHNRPDFLKRTLQSILNQTYENIEIIVISNGQNSANKAIVEALNSPILIYRDQVNSGGPAGPRNHGLRIAKGQYVAFCDDDDTWMPEKIEKQVNVLESFEKYGLCYTKMMRFDNVREWKISHEEGPATLDSLLYTNTVPISSVLIRKKLIDKYGGFTESTQVGPSEDYEFLLRYALHTHFYFLDDYLIRYWSGDNRTTLLDTKSKITNVAFYTKGLLGCYRLALMPCQSFQKRRLILPLFFHLKNALKRIIYLTLIRK